MFQRNELSLITNQGFEMREKASVRPSSEIGVILICKAEDRSPVRGQIYSKTGARVIRPFVIIA